MVMIGDRRRQARRLAKTVLQRVGWDERAWTIYASRNATGRRGLRDDRQLAFFLAAHLAADADCIDIGANKGKILEKVIAQAPEGHHIAVEPVPNLAHDLKQRFPSVDVHWGALADTEGTLPFYVATATSEWSGMQPRAWLGTDYQEIDVPVYRLDRLVPASRRVRFIKIDVEGAEVRVLRGAQDLLRRHGPALWIEHGERAAAAHGTTSHELWELLSDCGYRLWTADGVGPLSLSAFLGAREMPMWTFMAHQ
jgi:FkbM family methyltransferase